MNIRRCVVFALTVLCTLSAPLLNAKVSEAEAQKLKNELSPTGAEIAGNSDGTIPRWTGTMRGVPAGLKYSGSGDVYPDPYADEKPLFTITASNMDKYKDNLGEGQKAMLRKYPASFKIPVYPTHRDGRYNQLTEDRSWFNVLNTELVNGVDGLRNYTGGIPFPLPKSAGEVLWNGQLCHPNPTQDSVLDDVAVYPNGKQNLQTQEIIADYPYSRVENPVGMVDEAIGVNAALVLINQTKPSREKGKLTIVNDPLDAVTYKRNAWIYLPGSRRVRRAPTVAYDTPQGPGGLLTIDDTLGFNGAKDRYEVELVGKKEMYIPYHNYKFDDPNVKYKELLTPKHTNPDYMRYELHRVWIVELKLRPGARHIYAKRRFYIDEDSWQIALVDSYDGRGELWRTVILNTLYDYAIKGYMARAEVFHDLSSGAYIALRLVNETRPTVYDKPSNGDAYYTPQTLRKLGRR